MKYIVNGVEYTDLKEAEAAEKKFEADKKAKENAVAERKADAVAVQTKATDYINLVKENNKKRDELRAQLRELSDAEAEAKQAYMDELNDFAKKHDGYRLCYNFDGDNVEFQVEEVKADSVQQEIDNFYDEFNKMRDNFSTLFKNWWF